MLKKHWIFAINLLIFVLLLAKNPFSERSLIPNFEPYPDTIHYINSARSFIEGHGLQIYREGRALKTNVPPLYSIVLMPLFLIYNDPRMFYFTNVILALLAFHLFYRILSKLLMSDSTSHSPLTTNYLIIFITLFLYVTNYFFYWYPTLAMAENLTLTLFMGAVYLLLIPLSKKNAVYASLIAVAFYATKYASIPLTGFFFLSYLAKIYLDQRHVTRVKKNMKLYFILIFSSVFLFFVYSLWEWFAKGSTLLITFFYSFVSSAKSTSGVSSGGWFSLAYMDKYLSHYLRALAGGERVRFLWDDTPIVPLYVGIPALVGFVFGVIQKQTRFITLSLLLMLFSSILFMSTFYSQDMRYLYHAIPTLLIGFALFWKTILSWTFVSFPRRRESSLLITTLLIFLFLFYSLTNAIRLKKQIMLNLKYAETPWYYVSVLELNTYFATPPKPDNKKPIVISSMSPYYIDFFSNGNYSLLPLSLSQDFWNTPKETWGNNDYSNLISLYNTYLSTGHTLYINNYGIGNVKPLQNDFQKIKDSFIFTKVAGGCFDACNTWQLHVRIPAKSEEVAR